MRNKTFASSILSRNPCRTVTHKKIVFYNITVSKNKYLLLINLAKTEIFNFHATLVYIISYCVNCLRQEFSYSGSRKHTRLLQLINDCLHWNGFSRRYILLTKTTAARNGVALSYRSVRGLYFQAVVFCGDYSYL